MIAITLKEFSSRMCDMSGLRGDGFGKKKILSCFVLASKKNLNSGKVPKLKAATVSRVAPNTYKRTATCSTRNPCGYLIGTYLCT